MYLWVLKAHIYIRKVGKSIESWTADMKHSAQSNLYCNWKRDFFIPTLGICLATLSHNSFYNSQTKLWHFTLILSAVPCTKNPTLEELTPCNRQKNICTKGFVSFIYLFIYYHLLFLHIVPCNNSGTCSIAKLNLLIESSIWFIVTFKLV